MIKSLYSLPFIFAAFFFNQQFCFLLHVISSPPKIYRLIGLSANGFTSPYLHRCRELCSLTSVHMRRQVICFYQVAPTEEGVLVSFAQVIGGVNPFNLQGSRCFLSRDEVHGLALLSWVSSCRKKKWKLFIVIEPLSLPKNN